MPSASSAVRARTLLAWSSGKDSAWSLHLLRQRSDLEVVALLALHRYYFTHDAPPASICVSLMETSSGLRWPGVGYLAGLLSLLRPAFHI